MTTLLILILVLFLPAALQARALSEFEHTSKNSGLRLSEVFHYDAWGPDWRKTWNSEGTVVASQTAVATFLRFSNYNSPKDMAAVDSRKEFTFTYGVITWRARISNNPDIVNFLGVAGQDQRVNMQDGLAVNLTAPGILLFVRLSDVGQYEAMATVVCQSEAKALCTASSEWIAVSVNLSGFLNYTLHWTANEVVWSIENWPEAIRFNGTGFLNEEDPNGYDMSLRMGAYKTADFDNLYILAEFMVQSVVVKQNVSIPESVSLPSDFTLLLEDYFDYTNVSDLDPDNWEVVVEKLPRGQYFNFRLVIDCVEFRNSSLRLLRESDRGIQTHGRVTSGKNFAFRYGQVEWEMQFFTLRDPENGALWSDDYVTYWLGLEQFSCHNLSTCPFTVAFAVWANGQVLPYRQYFNGTGITNQQKYYKTFNNLVNHKTTEDAHRYRILWTEDWIVWYVDDTEIDRISKSEVKFPTEALRLSIMNDVHRSLNSDKFDDMQVNFVRIKRAPGQPDITTTPDQPDITTTAAVYKPDDDSLVLPLSVLIGFAVLVATGVAVWLCRRPRSRSAGPNSNYIADGLGLSNNSKLRSLLVQYEKLLDMPRDSVQIGNLIGTGEFANVYQGLVSNLPSSRPNNQTAIAVKKLKRWVDSDYQEAFAKEVKVMAKLGRHANVVNLLGMVLTGQPLLLLEYCRFGSLLSVLKQHSDQRFNRNFTIADISPPVMLPEDAVALQTPVPDTAEACKESTENGSLSTDDLICFAYQISRGMEYLTLRTIIHRDLAARNVLVADNRVLKICDFGLARHGHSVYLTLNPLALLPIFWMPPEAILDGIYSEKSDVWSFGVLLWELFTLGSTPFEAETFDKTSAIAFGRWLRDGHQLSRPTDTPSTIYEMMTHCWHLTPDDRPTFLELRWQLDNIINSNVHKGPYLPVGHTYSDASLDELSDQIFECLTEMGDAVIEVEPLESERF